jgi:hypothetical protein
MKHIPDLYAALAALHSNLTESADIVRELRRVPSLRSGTLRLFEAQLRELRALVCSELLERMAEHEATAASRYGRKRKALEQELKRDGA